MSKSPRHGRPAPAGQVDPTAVDVGLRELHRVAQHGSIATLERIERLAVRPCASRIRARWQSMTPTRLERPTPSDGEGALAGRQGAVDVARLGSRGRSRLGVDPRPQVRARPSRGAHASNSRSRRASRRASAASSTHGEGPPPVSTHLIVGQRARTLLQVRVSTAPHARVASVPSRRPPGGQVGRHRAASLPATVGAENDVPLHTPSHPGRCDPRRRGSRRGRWTRAPCPSTTTWGLWAWRTALERRHRAHHGRARCRGADPAASRW